MDIIQEFFGKIIPAKLNEPTQATLEFQDGTEAISVIVIPRINSDGHFVLDFYDGIARPEGRLFPKLDVAQSVNARFRNDRGVETLITNRSIANIGDRTYQISGRLMVVQREVILKDCLITSARFSLEDFPIFLGEMANENTDISASNNNTPMMSSSRILGYSKLITKDGWEITISECSNKGDIGTTHIGNIYRTNDGKFSIEELKHLLDGLTYFFNFITGVYRTPGVVIAYGSPLMNAVWGSAGKFNQFKYLRGNWFNPQSREAMSKLFPLFWSCFNSDEEKVRSVVGYYAESSIIAHAGLPKNALTDSQSALEGLSRWVLKRDQDRGESASQYIKKALDALGIRCDLHDYPNLLNLWQGKYKNDQDDDAGTTFITRLRNQSTHAKFQPMNTSDYLHAWNLSQHYVELMLLRLFSYNYDYYNRPSKSYKFVPWK